MAKEEILSNQDENNSNSTKRKKKSNSTLLIVIIIVVVFLIGLSVGGYLISQTLTKKANEGVIEKMIESGTGGKVNIDSKNKDVTIKTDEGTIKAGENVSWPNDMPSDIPKFTAGKLTMATKINTNPKGWSILVSDVENSNFIDYQAKLKAAGWAEVSSTSFGVSIVQMEKDNRKLTLSYDGSSKGVSLTISETTTPQ